MEKLLDGLSESIYKTFFSDTFSKNDWKIGYGSKSMDVTKQDTAYIGARFDELYWGETTKSTKKHFYIRFLKTQKENETKYTVHFSHRNTLFDATKIVKMIVNYFTENNLDEYLYISYADINYHTKIGTGVKSQHVENIMNAIYEYKKNQEGYDYANDEFRFSFITNIFKVIPDVEKEQVHLFIGRKKYTSFSTAEEAIDFLSYNTKENEMIKEFWKDVAKVFKERANAEVRNYGYSNIQIDKGKYYNISIKKSYASKKEKYTININNQKETATSITEAREKVILLSTKWANSYRLRKLTGTK